MSTNSIDTVITCLDQMMDFANNTLFPAVSPDNYSLYASLFDMIENAQGYAESEKKERQYEQRSHLVKHDEGEDVRQPTVPAVPLDKLCLLLHDIAGCPCHTQPGEDMCNRLIGDYCNPEWDDIECWKQFLTKWMEETDA